MKKYYEHVPDEPAHRLRTILGKGTFGVTFMMREISTGRRVAVKHLSAQRGKRERVREDVSTIQTILYEHGRTYALRRRCASIEEANMAIAEATTQIRLQHPSILSCERVFLGGETDDGDQLVCLVTPL